MTLARSPLSDDAIRRIYRMRWRKVSAVTAQVIAEMWNAGAASDAVGSALQLTPAQVQMVLGVLTRAGVELRKASTMRKPPSARRRLELEMLEDLPVKFPDGATVTDLQEWFGDDIRVVRRLVERLLWQGDLAVVRREPA